MSARAAPMSYRPGPDDTYYEDWAIDTEYLTMATMEGMRESACYLAVKDLIDLYGAERTRAFIAEALNELDPIDAPTD